jgi:uncharacterized protein (TIGR00255 family)
MPLTALRSMTGFGAACVARGGLSLRCEMRSVNHRHLVVRVKAPHELGGLDVELEKRVKARLARGSVTCSMWLERSGESTAATINTDLMALYAGVLRDFQIAHGDAVGGPVSIDRLLSMPGVVGGADHEGQTRATETADAQALALEAATAALDNMEAMRIVEGAALFADLEAHRDQLVELMAGVQKRMPVVVAEHFQALKRRVTELIEGAPKDADLARELAMLADRHDVSEELTRLDSHVAQLNGMLNEGGAVGRKLDFLIQEFLREVNTIGSKCNDAEVAHKVVNMKNVVERLREQVQNVE